MGSTYIIFFCGGLLLILWLITQHSGGLNIKARTVGDGQHGTARFATSGEIARAYKKVRYQPDRWRVGEERPDAAGIVVGSSKGLGGLHAWVDTDMIHAMMIASPNAGKTAHFLYPNIEYAMACGASFITLDTKGDLYRNMAPIGEQYYGYQTVVYDFRRPMQSDHNNLMQLVNRYMDAYKVSKDARDKARAEKYAKIVGKAIVLADADSSAYGQNAYFYDAAGDLVAAAILELAEYGPKEGRHIVSVIKLLQEASAAGADAMPGKKSAFARLIDQLPDDNKAKWFAGPALKGAGVSAASVLSTALSRLNAFLDTEMEQMLCFDSKLTMEEFVERPTAVYIVLPEEDTTKYFAVSLMIQQINRELIAIADDKGGRLPKKVLCFYDELGTVPKIQGLVQQFTAIRSRNVSLVGILQGTSQLEETYNKNGASTILDCCQVVLAGGFGPLSEDADKISKALGTRTVASGSVSSGNGSDKSSRTLTMMDRQLMQPDELRMLPKGDFVLMKTGVRPCIVHLPLFLDWGIKFAGTYEPPRQEMQKVTYANLAELRENILFAGGGRSVDRPGHGWGMPGGAAAEPGAAMDGLFGGMLEDSWFGNGLGGLFGAQEESGELKKMPPRKSRRKQAPAKGAKGAKETKVSDGEGEERP